MFPISATVIFWLSNGSHLECREKLPWLCSSDTDPLDCLVLTKDSSEESTEYYYATINRTTPSLSIYFFFFWQANNGVIESPLWKTRFRRLESPETPTSTTKTLTLHRGEAFGNWREILMTNHLPMSSSYSHSMRLIANKGKNKKSV